MFAGSHTIECLLLQPAVAFIDDEFKCGVTRNIIGEVSKIMGEETWEYK